ncbi:hypothetical protein CC79DRAFT_1166954 [Sarocladium strictum]
MLVLLRSSLLAVRDISSCNRGMHKSAMGNMTLRTGMDNHAGCKTLCNNDRFFVSYNSLHDSYPLSPPDKPLPQLPSPRYNLFPDIRKPSYTVHAPPSEISTASPIATASLLSVSDISSELDDTAGGRWQLECGTVSRPDSCTLPPTPGLQRDRPEATSNDDAVSERGDSNGVFFAVERSDEVVKFWVRLEDASMDDALEIEGVPAEERRRLMMMARELRVESHRGGKSVEHIQLLVGTYCEDLG